MKNQNRINQMKCYSSKKLYLRILDNIYKEYYLDPTPMKYEIWNDTRNEIIELLSKGHGIPANLLRGALDAPDGLRGQEKPDSRKILNELVRKLNKEKENE